MRVLILYGARARRAPVSKRRLVRMFQRAGHDVRYRSAHRQNWNRDLRGFDAVVAIGGDGTVAKVAIALARQRGAPPLAVIPAGKANNIARALGLPAAVSRIATGLARARRVRLAIGLIRSPWGTARFVESAGIGPLAALLRTNVPTLRGALRFLRAAFRTETGRALRLRADNRAMHGRFVLAHVMNIAAAGPRLVYAPHANPGDRTLDLVLLRESDRNVFGRYLDRLAAGKRARCPLVSIRARQVEITPWPARDRGHLDDRRWPGKQRPKRGAVRITVETTIPVLVPRA